MFPQKSAYPQSFVYTLLEVHVSPITDGQVRSMHNHASDLFGLALLFMDVSFLQNKQMIRKSIYCHSLSLAVP
jgi:hypothetical protein